MTNFERLRTMTADEICAEGCALDIRCYVCKEMNGRSDYCPGDCRGMLKKWLESEAKEKNDEGN